MSDSDPDPFMDSHLQGFGLPTVGVALSVHPSDNALDKEIVKRDSDMRLWQLSAGMERRVINLTGFHVTKLKKIYHQDEGVLCSPPGLYHASGSPGHRG